MGGHFVWNAFIMGTFKCNDRVDPGNVEGLEEI